MALTDILHKITTEAEEEAGAIIDTAKKKMLKMQNDAAEKQSAAEVQIQEETVKRKQSMERKVHSHSQMEAKMGEAALKSELLNAVKQAALKKIQSLPEKAQREMMAWLLSRISEEGTVLPAKGQKSLLEKAIKDSGKSFSVGKEANITGGFLFTSKTVDINCSFEALLEKDIFPWTEAELSAVLFS